MRLAKVVLNRHKTNQVPPSSERMKNKALIRLRSVNTKDMSALESGLLKSAGLRGDKAHEDIKDLRLHLALERDLKEDRIRQEQVIRQKMLKLFREARRTRSTHKTVDMGSLDSLIINTV